MCWNSAADWFISGSTARPHWYVILSVTWEGNNWNVLPAIWCTIPPDRAGIGNSQFFKYAGQKWQQHSCSIFVLLCEMVEAKPMDSIFQLIIKQNLKNVCENCLQCDFLQLGLVYLSLAAMDIQWTFRKLLLKLSKIQNEFHWRLQICSIIVMNRDINITTIKMSALLVSERIVLILFAVINGRHNWNLRWNCINAPAGGKGFSWCNLAGSQTQSFFMVTQIRFWARGRQCCVVQRM